MKQVFFNNSLTWDMKFNSGQSVPIFSQKNHF